MAKKLVPAEFKTHIIDQLIESVTERANTSYYAFIGDHETVASTLEEVNPPLETVNKLNSEVFRNMIFGKRINSNDMRFMIKRNNWESGTVFEMYDDQKQELQDSNFYTVVDEDSFKHVYKCLNNANGAPSTIKPLFEDAKYDADLYVVGDDYYETSDGYQWKYMYSIPSSDFTKFATEKYIPVLANTQVETNAVEGSIDVIKIVTHGKNYQNHIKGKFLQSDLNRITASIAAIYGLTNASRVYRLAVGANQTRDFYKNTIMYLSSGVGSGQYKKIVKSIEIPDIGGVFVELEDNFTTIPDDTTTYEISPAVQIVGDGTQTVNAVARAIINATASDSIHKIEMLNVGANYSYAAATVLTGDPQRDSSGNSIDVTPATIRPITAPQGGHGANTIVEFGATRLAFSTRLNRDESGLVEPTNTFSQFGIIRNPQFANVAIYTENVSGSFIEGETICQITKIQLGDQLSWTANSAVGNYLLDQSSVTDNEYGAHFNEGDYVFVKTSGVAPSYRLYTVGNASNTTAIHIASTLDITDGTSCTVYYVHKQAEATVKNINPPFPITNTPTSGMLVDNCSPEFRKGRLIFGLESKNIATIKGIDINRRINDGNADFIFNNFNQMTKIIGSSVTGTFIQDETVIQGSANAQLHSVTGGNTLNLTNVTGDFSTVGLIKGAVTEAEMEGTQNDQLDIVYGDLDPNSGSIIYLQNDIPVDRDENQTEEIRVILEF